MRIAYLDCASGISGDMTLGALVDAGADLAAIQAGIDSLGLPSCRLVASEVKKRGFRATQITVEHEPEHKHRHLHHITAMIDGSTLTPRQTRAGQANFSEAGRGRGEGARLDDREGAFSRSGGRRFDCRHRRCRRSGLICSASSASCARRCRRVTGLSRSPTAGARFRRRRRANCCEACRSRRSMSRANSRRPPARRLSRRSPTTLARCRR